MTPFPLPSASGASSTELVHAIARTFRVPVAWLSPAESGGAPTTTAALHLAPSIVPTLVAATRGYSNFVQIGNHQANQRWGVYGKDAEAALSVAHEWAWRLARRQELPLGAFDAWASGCGPLETHFAVAPTAVGRRSVLTLFAPITGTAASLTLWDGESFQPALETDGLLESTLRGVVAHGRRGGTVDVSGAIAALAGREVTVRVEPLEPEMRQAASWWVH